MPHERIADGIALAAVEGRDVQGGPAGIAVVVDLQDEPQRAAWNAYRVAFRTNEAEPKLAHAVALVRSWNGFAAVMGLEQIVIEADE